MPTNEITEVRHDVPFALDERMLDEAGPGFMMIRWMNANSEDVPPYWSMSRDKWLRNFVYKNGAIKTAVNTFVNKVSAIPWSVQAKHRSISRHVVAAEAIEESLRRISGSMSSTPMKGFETTIKMFVKDFLTQDNGAFMAVMGEGRANGPIVGAPTGLLHLDSALCTRTKDLEFPVKYLNAGFGGDHKEYKLHHTRVIEMVNLPSTETDLNGIGLCAVSCCIEAAQELYDIYRYNQEMFGSKPPRQILYAKEGATVKTMQDAVEAWQLKLAIENRTRFGGTLFMAPRTMGMKLDLGVLNLSQMPTEFNRRDVTTIDKSEIAAAFGLDLRDLAYVMGAPSRTGDAEVQDKKGRGKGVGEFLETFMKRMQEVYLNNELFSMSFDNLDDDQDEQEGEIRDKRSQARERDLRAGITTIRIERETMWENNEITYEQFAQMELEDGRLPEGLDVLLLFQSEDRDYGKWLDLGVSDPTNIAENDPQKMSDTIHDKYIELSRLIHEETKPDKRRKARQALAALDKLRSMYQVPEGQAISDQAALEATDAGAAAGVDPTAASASTQATAATPKPQADSATSPAAKERVVSDAPLEKQLYMGDDPDIQQYEQQFAGLVERADRGEISRERFEGAMEQIVASIILSLFLKGARLTYGELSEEARTVLGQELTEHLASLDSFADDLYAGRYGEGDLGLDAAYGRVATWLNIAAGIFFLGQTYQQFDVYLRWNFSFLKEHCGDCVRLNGQVHTASEWRNSGWYPRSFGLECHGVHCGCFFTEVAGPSQGGY